MLAIVLALSASLAWGCADFFGGLKSRVLGALAVLVVSQLAGTVVIATVVAARGQGPAGPSVLLAIPAGTAGILGLFAFYRGMAVGAISIVAPIAGIAAVIPVVVGIASGDRLGALQAAGIALALVGVGLASRDEGAGGRRARLASGAGLALLAAIGFGSYFPIMHAAARTDLFWAVLLFRTTAASLVATAAAVVRPRARFTPPDLAAAAAVGVLDVTGNFCFAAASDRGLVSIVSVLASLYPVVTVALARIVLREQVAPLQQVGAGAALAGVVLLSAG